MREKIFANLYATPSKFKLSHTTLFVLAPFLTLYCVPPPAPLPPPEPADERRGPLGLGSATGAAHGDLAFLEGGAPAALTELGDEGTACWSKFKDYVAS